MMLFLLASSCIVLFHPLGTAADVGVPLVPMANETATAPIGTASAVPIPTICHEYLNLAASLLGATDTIAVETSMSVIPVPLKLVPDAPYNGIVAITPVNPPEPMAVVKIWL